MKIKKFYIKLSKNFINNKNNDDDYNCIEHEEYF